MITILLTCLLLAGETFTPPADWTIETIIGGGKYTGTMLYFGPLCLDGRGSSTICPEPRYETKVTLRRTLAVEGTKGTWDIPKGCTLLHIERDKP